MTTRLHFAAFALVAGAGSLSAHEILSFEHLQGGNVHALTMLSSDLAFSAEDGGRIRRWDRNATTGAWSSDFMQTPYDSRYLLRDIHFADSQYGWACGYGGRLLRTQDGGASWSPWALGVLTKPGSSELADLYSVRFLWDSSISEFRGWVVGFDGAAYTSTDGGGSWTALSLPASLASTDLYGLAVKPLGGGLHRIWISGDLGTILRSSDNGATWDATHALSTTTCAPGNVELWDLEMLDASAGITVGGVGNGCGVAWTTIDGGLSWQPDTCFNDNGLSAPHDAWSTVYNATLGLAPSVLSVGYASQLNLRSATPACWNQTTDPTLSYLGHPPTFGVAAMGGRALVSGLFNLVRSSDDGGQTWDNQAGLHYLRSSDAAFADASIGCVAGQGYRILRSTDGMQTFTQVHVGTNLGPNLRGIAVSPANTQSWLAVGDAEGGYAYVARSTNLALTWARLPSTNFPVGLSSTARLNELAFHPTQIRVALVVGLAGVVLETANLGNSFSLANTGIPSGTDLEGVAYTPSGDAFVVGSDAGGSAWRRASGTSTWVNVPLKDALGSTTLVADLNAVASGGGAVWAVGDAGTMFVYESALGEFRAVVPPSPHYDPTEDFLAVAIQATGTENHVVISGANGGIRYTNGTAWTSPRSQLSSTGEEKNGALLRSVTVFPDATDPDAIRGYVLGRQFQLARFVSPGGSW